MKLICRIEGASVFGAETVKDLHHGSLTIGRGADCGWVLNDPDRAMSTHHCTIDWVGDGYTLTDTSTNGVFVNGARRPIGRGQTAPLSDGHLLAIGPYKIRISIEPGPAPEIQVTLPASVAEVPEGWIGEVPQAGFGADRQPARAGWDAPPEPHLLGATSLAAAGPAEAFSALAQQSEAASSVATMIRVPVARAVLPPDWDVAAEDNPLRPPTIQPRATPAPVQSPLMDTFLDGAGLPNDLLHGADPSAAARDLGRMLRAAVTGLRDLLGSRKLAKAELRVEATVVKASGNSALKFSPDADRALLAIAGQPLPGFLPGVESIEEGLRDIKGHELALVATISILLNEISGELDPAAIKAKVGDSAGLLPASKRARYWDEYEAAFAALGGGEPGATLVQRFAQAYALQVKRSTSGVAGA